MYNLEKINSKWIGYDSHGNSWRIFKRRKYWDAIADMSREDKLAKVHYLCANTLRDLACCIRDKGGNPK